jgi:hypothetical protein
MNRQDKIKDKVLWSIKTYQKATPSMVANHLAYSTKTVQNAIQGLRKDGTIYVCGSTKSKEGPKGESIYAVDSAFSSDNIVFIPEYQPEVIKSFKRSIQGTPWDGLRACV